MPESGSKSFAIKYRPIFILSMQGDGKNQQPLNFMIFGKEQNN